MSMVKAKILIWIIIEFNFSDLGFLDIYFNAGPHAKNINIILASLPMDLQVIYNVHKSIKNPTI